VDLGGRSPKRILRALTRPDTWRAGAAMLTRYERPLECSRRYLTGSGAYPFAPRLRTPTGAVAPTLHSVHDMWTVNEIFCRQDYRCGRDLRVAVDIGANIGLSALYFLTRNASSRVYAFEPDPKNIARLRENLHDYESRYELGEVAVALETGTATFGVEPIGRYGTLSLELRTGHPPTELIEVRTRALNEILAEVLADHDQIDILKIDVEGLEEDLVAAIPTSHLERIRTIVYETNTPAPLHNDLFTYRYSSQTSRLDARQPRTV
jgi:FkbM family methyltransferase